MNLPARNRRAVVVGAGIGGLSSAIELAASGWSVSVFEALPRVGGKANNETVDGVVFDTGPSLLTMPHVFEALFARAGRSMHEHLELVRPDPAFVYRWPDGTELVMAHEPEQTLVHVERALGADARKELEAFLRYARRIWDAAEPHFVSGPAPKLTGIARLGLSGLLATTRIDAFRSMARAIRAQVRHPALRDVLLRYATYNGSDPRVAPATLNCIAWVELGLGGYGVRGGMSRLAEELAEAARSLGVEIACGQRVERIAHDGGRARGVVVGGQVVTADIVVANADVAHVERALIGEAAPNERRRTEPSTSGHTVVVKAAPSPSRAAHTVFFAAPYTNEFVDLFDHSRPPVTPTVYACDQHLAHGRTGWADGASPVFLMANTPAVPRGTEVPPQWANVETALLERAISAGIVRSDDPLVWRRGPDGLAATFPDTGGALYGAASNGMWSAFRRPANRHARIGGLYLASGSAHPGGGVPLCALSGRRAAMEAELDRRERAP